MKTHRKIPVSFRVSNIFPIHLSFQIQTFQTEQFKSNFKYLKKDIQIIECNANSSRD